MGGDIVKSLFLKFCLWWFKRYLSTNEFNLLCGMNLVDFLLDQNKVNHSRRLTMEGARVREGFKPVSYKLQLTVQEVEYNQIKDDIDELLVDEKI